MTYQDLIEKLGNRSRRKLANNTYAERREGGAVTVKLHNTDILTYYANGHIKLDTGGWRTSTTKQRFNKFLDWWRVSQENFDWYIYPLGAYSERVEYFDKIVITEDGTCIVSRIPEGV